ncbi:MAG: RsmE family RNA methyltransferase [Fimbriiglobus sp.]
MADRFYTDLPLNLGDFILDGSEAHHLGTVRRFDAGDIVTLFNGDGQDYEAEVVAVMRKRVYLNIQAIKPNLCERPDALIIASALPKGDRAEFMLEKLTELGVTEFVPLITSRSVVVPRDNAKEKFERIVIEASKQCGRSRFLKIATPAKFDDYLKTLTTPAYILHTSPTPPPTPTPGPKTFLIGPEGGFSPEELVMAEHLTPLHFGPRTLRTETATLAAAVWAG